VGDRRYLAISAAIGVCAVLALAGNASAQQCAHPNVRASAVQAALPHVPVLARQIGIEGDVQVVVTLDEQSHVIGTAIQSSPSGILNAAALEAARETVFQTEIRDCRPVPGSFIFVVTFQKSVPEPSAVFGGKGDAPTLTVVDRGSAARAPDVAVIRVTFFSRGTSNEAALAADRAADDLFRMALRAQGIADTVVTDTSGGGTPVVNGFTIVRTVIVRAKPGSETVRAVANAATAGASSILLRYAVTDDDGLYRDALANAERAAATRARDSAASASRTLGKRTEVRPLDFRTHATTDNSWLSVAGGAPRAVPDPPAQLEAGAAVTVVYALDP
jgi:uncharacterized protein YggE